MDCQRCHGSGRNHVRYPPTARSTAAISNGSFTSIPAGELFEVNIVHRVELMGSKLLP